MSQKKGFRSFMVRSTWFLGSLIAIVLAVIAVTGGFASSGPLFSYDPLFGWLITIFGVIGLATYRPLFQLLRKAIPFLRPAIMPPVFILLSMAGVITFGSISANHLNQVQLAAAIAPSQNLAKSLVAPTASDLSKIPDGYYQIPQSSDSSGSVEFYRFKDGVPVEDISLESDGSQSEDKMSGLSLFVQKGTGNFYLASTSTPPKYDSFSEFTYYALKLVPGQSKVTISVVPHVSPPNNFSMGLDSYQPTTETLDRITTSRFAEIVARATRYWEIVAKFSMQGTDFVETNWYDSKTGQIVATTNKMGDNAPQSVDMSQESISISGRFSPNKTTVVKTTTTADGMTTVALESYGPNGGYSGGGVTASGSYEPMASGTWKIVAKKPAVSK